MNERKAEDRTRLNTSGMILADEHKTMSCIISDRSATSIRVTSLEAEDLPDIFVLTLDDTAEALVCRVTWRKTDEIGCLAELLAST